MSLHINTWVIVGIPRSSMAGSNGKSICNIDICQIPIHGGCHLLLYSYQMVPQCHLKFLFSCLEMENLFLCLRSICFSSVTIHMYCPFSTEFLSFSRSFLYLREIRLCDMNCKPFFQVCHLCFDFAYQAMQKFFYVYNFINLFFYGTQSLSHSKKAIPFQE